MSTPNLTRTHSIFQELITYDLERRSGHIKVRLKDFPYFSDHSVNDIIILPGSVYAEMALFIYSIFHNKIPRYLQNLAFGNLTILSEEEVTLTFRVSELKETIHRIEFREFNEDKKSKNIFSTSVEIEDSNTAITGLDIPKNALTEFTDNADSTMLSDEFYQMLWSNGNQYGPYFRNLKQIWIKGEEALAEFDFSYINNLAEQFILDPLKLDSFSQLLSVLTKQQDRTFILSSISGIHIINPDLPSSVWCSGKLLKITGQDEFEGELKIYDDAGSMYLEITGVKFKYLEKSQQNGNSETAEGEIVISSTFTSEPIEDSLKFWNNFFKTSFNIRFAPYNQIFQELLHPQSLMASNKKGFNIILLSMEDWTKKEYRLIPLVDQNVLDNLFKGKASYTLPNHVEIVHLNTYETEYVYKEIFADKCYLKHGITINDGDTIIDIGANIGLFTLFVNQYCKDPVVYSFEPSPVVYDLLKTNTSVYCSNVKTFNCGVSDEEKIATFTFYEKSSVFSSFNADETEDKEAIQAVVRNLLTNTSEKHDSLEEEVNYMTSDRLESKNYECRLLSVSDIIRENNISKIDLLKIDAEKSELSIIRGIKDEDWKKINQIVIEIHDKSGKILKEIECILKSKGFNCTIEEEDMLKMSGLFNVFARRKEQDTRISGNHNLKFKEDKLIENVENLSDSINSFIKKSQVPLIVLVTPRSTNLLSEPGLADLYVKYENDLLQKLKDTPNVFTISSASLLEAYPVENYYDQLGDDLGSIPYSSVFFTAMGTILSRLILSIQSAPKKVIALDCDNTLWKGVCGEEGANGIQITEVYRQFHQFLINQMQSGMLLCLCSKNNEEDVFEVFRERGDMLLNTEHLVSWKLNWNDKSANLASLAEELNVGLDSFIFLDDNPVECAEVKSKYPEVLTLQFPLDEKTIPAFIRNTWAFDHLRVTEEDKKRTLMYKQNAQREKHRSSSLTLQHFLEGLDLKIKIKGVSSEQISRVSQLTFRTNQFNFTTKRRSEHQIIEFLEDINNQCLVVEVSDRFGDYGLVGVLLYSKENTTIKIDTMLLSCRVLGRGVEYQMLSVMGKLAANAGIDYIELKYIPTLKNKPALNFIEKTGSQFLIKYTNEFIASFPSEYLMNINYHEFLEQEFSTAGEGNTEDIILPAKEKSYSELSDKLQIITGEFTDAVSIHRKIEESKTGENSIRENIMLPETVLGKDISALWQQVLGRKNISLDDNFFEIGGNSLKAVQLIASLKKDLNRSISIADIYECPTIGMLLQKLETPKAVKVLHSDPESGIQRGERRRNIRLNRKTRN